MKPLEKQLQQVKQLQKDIINDEDITIEMLYKCRKILAKIIKNDGDTFLPIFIRLENEIKTKEQVNNYKIIALQIAENE